MSKKHTRKQVSTEIISKGPSLSDVVLATTKEAGRLAELRQTIEADKRPTPEEEVTVFVENSIIFLHEHIGEKDFLKFADLQTYAQFQVAAEVYIALQETSPLSLEEMAVFVQQGGTQAILPENIKVLQDIIHQQKLYAVGIEEEKLIAQLAEELEKKDQKIELSALRGKFAPQEKDIEAFSVLLKNAGVQIEAGKQLDNAVVRALREVQKKDQAIQFGTLPKLEIAEDEHSTKHEVLNVLGLMRRGEYIGVNTFTSAEVLAVCAVARNIEEATTLLAKANDDKGVTDEIAPIVSEVLETFASNQMPDIGTVEDIAHIINIRRLLVGWNENVMFYVLTRLYGVTISERTTYSFDMVNSNTRLAALIADEFWKDLIDGESDLKKVHQKLVEINARSKDAPVFDTFDSIFLEGVSDDGQKMLALMMLVPMVESLTPQEKQRLLHAIYTVVSEYGQDISELRDTIEYADGIQMVGQVAVTETSPLMAIRSIVELSMGGGVVVHGRKLLNADGSLITNEIGSGALLYRWLTSQNGKMFADAFPMHQIEFENPYDQYMAALFTRMAVFRTREGARSHLKAFADVPAMAEAFARGEMWFPIPAAELSAAAKDAPKFRDVVVHQKKFPLNFVDVFPMDLENMSPEEAFQQVRNIILAERQVWGNFVLDVLTSRFQKYALQFKWPVTAQNFVESPIAILPTDFKALQIKMLETLGLPVSLAENLSGFDITGLETFYKLTFAENILIGHAQFLMPTPQHRELALAVLDIPCNDGTYIWSYEQIVQKANEMFGEKETNAEIARFVYRRFLFIQVQQEMHNNGLLVAPELQANMAAEYFILGEHTAAAPLQQALFEQRVHNRQNHGEYSGFVFSTAITTLRDVFELFDTSRDEKFNAIEPITQGVDTSIVSMQHGVAVASVAMEILKSVPRVMSIPPEAVKAVAWEFSRIVPGLSEANTVRIAQILMSSSLTGAIQNAQGEVERAASVAGRFTVLARETDVVWDAFISAAELNIRIKAQGEYDGSTTGTVDSLSDAKGTIPPTSGDRRILVQEVQRVLSIVEKLEKFNFAGEGDQFVRPVVDRLTEELERIVEPLQDILEINTSLSKGAARTLLQQRKASDVSSENLAVWLPLLQSLPAEVTTDLANAETEEELTEALVRPILDQKPSMNASAELITNHPMFLTVREFDERFGVDARMSLSAVILMSGATIDEIERGADIPLIEFLLPEFRGKVMISKHLELTEATTALAILRERIEAGRTAMQPAPLVDAIEEFAIEEEVPVVGVFIAPKKKKMKAKERREMERRGRLSGAHRSPKQRTKNNEYDFWN